MAALISTYYNVTPFQRVQAEGVQTFIHGLRNIIHKLHSFMGLSLKRSIAAFNRINIGIINMVTLVAGDDLELLNGVLTDCYTGYGAHDAIIVYSLQILIEETHARLNRVFHGSVYVGENRTFTGMIQLVSAALDALRSAVAIPEQRIKYAPSHLLHSNRYGCEDAVTSMGINLSRSSVGTNRDNRNISIQQAQSQIIELDDFHKMQKVRGCITGLELNLNAILSLTTDLERSMNHVSVIADGLFYGGDLKLMRSDLDILNDSIDWLSEQLSAYSENRTTKIKLSNQINEAMLSDIVNAMNHIISVINVDIIEPFLSRTRGLRRDISRIYKNILNAIKTLKPYYDETDIGEKLRALKIWRHPVAMLDTVDVLQFKYPASESWRSWALNVSFNEFVLSGSAVKKISSMVKEHSTVLTDELLRMRSEFYNARDDTIETFNEVSAHLKNVRMESKIGYDFILWVSIPASGSFC